MKVAVVIEIGDMAADHEVAGGLSGFDVERRWRVRFTMNIDWSRGDQHAPRRSHRVGQGSR